MWILFCSDRECWLTGGVERCNGWLSTYTSDASHSFAIKSASKVWVLNWLDSLGCHGCLGWQGMYITVVKDASEQSLAFFKGTVWSIELSG